MKLKDIMIQEVIQIGPDESIGAAAKRMSDKAVGCLVVTVAGTVKGILTDRDLLACLAQSHDPYGCKVSAHMHRPVNVLRPEETTATAASVMQRRKIKRLPIAKNGKLVGIVSLSDLAALAGKEGETLGASLEFFTSVVGAQSAQSLGLRLSPVAVPAASAGEQEAELDATGNNDRMVDVGGPG
jgi:signal-transduction protein with cAMP-binding, CBS, and nucleotidyltransferase domain